MRQAPFLFPIELREEFFRVSAFGAARAVEWLRTQQDSGGALGDRLGALRVERWLIKRDDFLNDAHRLLVHHAARRSLLEVEFQGESGIGTGVHVAFFTDAAARLTETEENERVRMWMPDAAAPKQEALQCALHPASMLQQTAAPAVTKVLRRFELLGWLFGKALMDKRHDERLLPLHLSPVFIDLCLGRDLSSLSSQSAQHGEWAGLAALASTEVLGGAQVALLLTQLAGVRDGSLSEDAATEMIELCEMTFTNPSTHEELCPGGAERPVAFSDLEEYLGLLAAAWLGEGIRLQCDAFSRALSQVVPLDKLALFATSELLELVCGAAVEWTEAELEECVVPGDGYTRSSAPYRWLLEFLSEMGAADRAAFLQFVTARPRLPAGGLRALPSPIRVQQPAATSASEGGGASAADALLPTAHTCSLTLDLPAFASAEALRGRVAEALRLMGEYEGLVD
eukprot:COSAG04_NODE_194_length_20815_cov_4.321591_16_plen_456_part_00